MKMKILFSIFIVLFFQFKSDCQITNPCGVGWTKSYKVTSDNGINLRSEPNINSDILIAIPFNTYILSGKNCEKFRDTISDKFGHWIKTSYQGKTGYVFSIFLQEVEEVPLRKGFCQFGWNEYIDFKKVLKEDNYLALYYKDKTQGGRRKFEFKSINKETNLNFESTHDKIKGIDFPVLIITGLEINEQVVNGKIIDKMLFPGDQEEISLRYEDRSKNSRNIFFALGEIERDTQKHFLINGIQNYQLKLYITNFSKKKEILLFETNIHAWGAGGFENKIILKWIGDLNADGKVDMLIAYNFTYKGGYYKLYLSNDNPKNGSYSEIDMGGW